MKLREVFHRWLQTPRQMARTLIFHGVAGDREAVTELRDEYGVWDRVDMEKLGGLISGIAADLSLLDTDPGYRHALQQKRERLSELIEGVWIPAINGWVDTRLDEVDLEALRIEELRPEPEVGS